MSGQERWPWAACLGGVLAVHAVAAEPADVRVERGIPYAADREGVGRTLDLHAPAGPAPKPRPVILFVHGGGWRHGDKEMVGAKPAAFAERGWAFASANYRLDETVSPREQAQDVADAIGWLHEHGPEHGCDPGRIVLLGHSAGAHLVALVSTDGRFLEARGLDLSAIAGTILLDGAGYDVPRQIEIARLPRMREMYRQVFTEDPQAQREASPITHVAAGNGIPPFLLFHVGARQDSREQSEALA
ncbi:MAG: alpha/beta hydrolase, partial [Planctomycetaceae bacterium]